MKFDLEKYKHLFTTEAREHLENISKILEQSKDSIEESHINVLFREAHSLKGMAAAMGYQGISELSHNMENILGEIRNGRLVYNKNINNILIEATDILFKAILAIESGKEIGNFAEIIEKLNYSRNFIQEKPKDIETDNKTTYVKIGDHIRIKINIYDNIPSPSARIFLIYKNIAAFGEVIESIPTLDQIKKGLFDTNFIIKLIPERPLNALERYLANVKEIKSYSIEEHFKENKKEEILETQFEEKSKLPQFIKVEINTLDYFLNITGELLTIESRIRETTKMLDNIEVSNSLNQMEILLKDLQDKVMKMRLTPLEIVFSNVPRWVRDISKKLNKKVNVEITGDNIELDRSVVEALWDPLLHIIRNAIDHGIESPDERKNKGKDPIGKINIEAEKLRDKVVVTISDDGRGIDPEKVKEAAIKSGKYSKEFIQSLSEKKILYLITTPGLSTKQEVTDMSGRGVGIDVVKTALDEFGGTLEIDSEVNKGTTISLILPSTISIINVLFFKVGDYTFGTPVDKIISVFNLNENIEKVIIDGKKVIDFKGEFIPIVYLRDKFSLKGDKEFIKNNDVFAIVINILGKKTAVIVDTFLGHREVYLRPLNPPLSLLPGFYSSTILGDGTAILVIDLEGLLS